MAPSTLSIDQIARQHVLRAGTYTLAALVDSSAEGAYTTPPPNGGRARELRVVPGPAVADVCTLQTEGLQLAAAEQPLQVLCRRYPKGELSHAVGSLCLLKRSWSGL
eukprot:1195288-Prorocentrum_minimum.AAC.2